jgi:ankyrin repeat protein
MEIIKYLLDNGADPTTDRVSESLLWTAQFPYFDIKIVELLAKAGADINYWPPKYIRYPRQAFPLLISVVRRGEAEVLRLLIQQGANLEIRDDSGRTPLLWAGLSYDQCPAENQLYSFEIVRLLVEGGANVNVRATPLDGWQNYCESWETMFDTPLLQATKRGDVEAVQVLLAAGADVEAKDSQGWTALDFAMQTGQQEIVKVLLEASQQ